LLSGTATLNPTLSYTVTVGAGGIGGAATGGSGTSGASDGGNGNSSVFNAITASGGGGGGAGDSRNGLSGASGGGGAGRFASTGGAASPAGQGNAGGSASGTASNYFGGGGGGSSSAGTTGANQTSNFTSGGNGTASSISGTSVTYAGGGGGSSYGIGVAVVGLGGSGGGGAGGYSSDSGLGTGTAGTANLGGGGGGGANGPGGGNSAGGSGGSGVVIISYPAPQQFGGGVVTTSGSNVIHTFNTSGTLTPLSSLTASYLIVAGGGAGSSGGGGAGGMQTGSGVTIDANSIYVVTVGSGGAGALPGASTGNSGSNSSFSAYATASVGGGGGGLGNGTAGASGGSGGGGGGNGSGSAGAGGAATSGQGNAGGAGFVASGRNPSGGGGGAGAVGGTATGASTSTGGNGGAGLASSISGTSTYYAGGGGGGGDVSGSGGTGGGGAASTSSTGTSGTANTGGGGGGVFNNFVTGSGGSGVVIISYAGSTQQMAGGTVTIVGGNVIHTFTSSGYLTPIKYVNNSLRFRSSASAYLNRTPATASNRKTWTWSGWVKRGTLGTEQSLFATVSQGCSLFFGTGNDLRVWTNGGNAAMYTSAVYRDPAAWYHIVLQRTSVSPYFNLYVNGVQVTSFAYDNRATYPGTADSEVNNTVAHYISGFTSYYFDGYLTEVNMVDGQALTPNSFGTFNSYGVWQPITYGGSYGTNGFYLPFTNKTSTTTLGYDFSPNGNNWTTNNISVTAGATYDSMTDVPTLTSATAANYAVFNPLLSINGAATTFSNGNLQIATASGSNSLGVSTIPTSSGKWYFEATQTASGDATFGIWQPFSSTTLFYVSPNNNYRWYGGNGNVYDGAGSVVQTYSSYTAGDVLGIALDLDNGKVYYSKNNVYQGSSNPVTGTNPVASGLTGTWLFGCNTGGTGATFNGNFGQQPFVYTPPTGYIALNTYNL
jgi:hypothetical protein